MLGKLMKYELKATARMFLPFYIAVVGLAIASRIFQEITLAMANQRSGIVSNMLNTIYIITTVTFVFAVVAVCMLSPIVAIYRFHKNLLKDEGYLMMTLPVKTSQHIWSKLHTSFIWFVASALVAGISLTILVSNSYFWGSMFFQFRTFFTEVFGVMKDYPGESAAMFLLAFQLLLACVIGLYYTVITFYTCLAIGHKLSHKHPILTAIAVYMGINFVTQIAISFLMIFAGSLMGHFNLFDFYFSSVTTITQSIMLINLFVLLINVLAAGVFVLFFYFTNRIMTRSLNLD